MGEPVQEVRGLNLRIDMSKIDEALKAQPRVVVSTVNADVETTLLEISRRDTLGNALADNQVNVLC